jgi:phospholipid/cholesterol/gamma-HCH transport system ATP-binding protein
MSEEAQKGLATVELRDVWKSFRAGRDQILKGVSIEFLPGQLTYVLGPSGTGKSVTLKHILGLLTPDSGSVHVFGQDISKLSGEAVIEFRQRFGMVFQNSALFDDMTVFENVAFPLREHTDWSEGKIIGEVDAVLTKLGLPKPYDKFPSEISGGMKKRVGIARAIVRRPEILLYDEPTTGLDPETRQTVDELIEKIKTEFRLTSIVISHDIPSALRLADQIIFLNGGKVVFVGNPAEFVKSTDAKIVSFLRAEKVSYEALKGVGIVSHT